LREFDHLEELWKFSKLFCKKYFSKKIAQATAKNIFAVLKKQCGVEQW
jgi:hypothetical protein